MPGKIFVNYRRDDAKDMAARIRDRLAQTFGDANVFMDVDNLMAGQRFDRELEKALAQTDVFLAVIGPRWLDLLTERRASSERDYVREEIAGAVQRGVVVIPVLVERTLLSRAEALPEDIRDLVLHQTHEVAHARFGRDVGELIEAIRLGRKAAFAEHASSQPQSSAWPALHTGTGSEAEREWRAHDLDNCDEPGLLRAYAAKWETADKLWSYKANQIAARLEVAQLRRQADALFESCLREPGSGKDRWFRDIDIGPELVVVPAGSFTMGSNDYGHEQPPHEVTISRPFAVGRLPVTFAEWDAAGLPHKPGDEGWGRGQRPVINVSWKDAKSYAAWLSQKTGKTYRLLSEAEWECCCRAGTTAEYSFGGTITRQQALFGAKQTVEAGTFPSNAWGLHDMHGTVWEWSEDNWHPNYQGAPDDGSAWQDGDLSLRVLRGGSWYNVRSALRSANRLGYPSVGRNYSIGFRLARTL